MYKPYKTPIPDNPRSKCSRCGYYIQVEKYRMDTGLERFEKSGKNDRECDIRVETGEVSLDAEPVDDDILDDFVGMSDLELLHHQFRRKLMKKEVDIRVLDSFRQFLKEMDEFEKVKNIQEEELEEELQTKGVNQLVKIALGERRFEFSQSGGYKESSSRSRSSSSSSNSRIITRDGN